MKYEGSLYAKVNGRYLRLEYNTTQYDRMHEALKWLLDNHNDDNIMISSTEMNDKYTEDVVLDKLLKMYSLLKEIENESN